MIYEELMGKCGFYCGSCPTYRKGNCAGCLREHRKGDCFTRDCVISRGVQYCGLCSDFPCSIILEQEKCTILDKKWMRWKAEEKNA